MVAIIEKIPMVVGWAPPEVVAWLEEAYENPYPFLGFSFIVLKPKRKKLLQYL